MRIAIVGAGISGSSVLQTILNAPEMESVDFQIDIYDSKGNFATGIPYIEDDIALLMNSASKDLSLDPDNPREFDEWVEEYNNRAKSDENLVYRQVYGKYLEDHFAPSYDHAAVSKVTAEVTDVRVNADNTVNIATFSDGWLDTDYDFLFLAIGQTPYRNSYNLKGQPNYIHNPYPMSEKMPEFAPWDSVGIIGSGASGLDVMRYLMEHIELDAPVTFYVRDTLFTATGVPCETDVETSLTFEWLEENRHPDSGRVKLDTVLETVRADFAEYGVNWQDVVSQWGHSRLTDNMRAYYNKPQDLAIVQRYFVRAILILPHIFQAMNLTDQQRFLKDYYPYLTHMRASVPHLTMGRILNLIEENKLRIVDGLSEIKVNQDGQFDIYGEESYLESADILINATGFEEDIVEAAKQSHLLKSLIKRDMILPHDSGRGPLVSWPAAELISRQGKIQPIVMLGNIISSTQLGNNNARLIAQQGGISARQFIEKYVLKGDFNA